MTGGGCVKTYSSRKKVDEELWSHSEIVLKPNSFEKRFKDIVITKENAENMNVVGEFVAVLQRPS